MIIFTPIELLLITIGLYIVVVGSLFLLSWFIGKFILTDNQKP